MDTQYKLKAKELIDSFLYLQVDNFGNDYAVLCSINCVNQIIKSWEADGNSRLDVSILHYWKKVKIELENLQEK